MGSKRFYEHAQKPVKNCVWVLGGPKCVDKLGWVNMGVLGLACPTACTCLFKVRPGVLSKTLSHICGKLNLHMFLFNVGLLTLIDIDSLIFLDISCLARNIKESIFIRVNNLTLNRNIGISSCEHQIKNYHQDRKKLEKLLQRQKRIFSKLGLSPLIVS